MRDSENAPALSCIAETGSGSTGKNVNTATSAATATTLPATNGVALEVAAAGEPEREQHRRTT